MDWLSLLAALGGGAGVAGLLTALVTARGAARRAIAEANEVAARTMGDLGATWGETLTSLQADTAQLRADMRALEEELADSRREALALRDAVQELTGRIDAALMILSGTTDPAATAAARLLKTERPRAKRVRRRSPSKGA
jgi:predicted  nucleic acid-binding Zn-ribbon protein